MDDITMEKRMELVQQIRNQYHRNQYDLSNRERILYGRTTGISGYENPYHENTYAENISAWNDTEKNSTSESLKLRSAVATILFVLIVLFDFLNLNIAGIEAKQVFTLIAQDYQENVSAFVETLAD